MAKAAPKKKTGKRVNIKLKRTVRKALAAVLMMTAIIIAAVPVPDVAADDPLAIAPFPYSYVKGADIDFGYPTGFALDASNPTTDKLAYTVSKDDKGAWSLNWQFKFYMQKYDGASVGVVSKYNNLYAQKVVELPTHIPSEYCKVTKAEYDQYYTTNGAVKKTVTAPELVGDVTGDIEFFEKFFKDDYTKYLEQNEQYKIAKKLYDDWVTAGSPPAKPVAKPAVLDPLVKLVSEISDDGKLIYYCDMNSFQPTVEPNSPPIPLKGYKLQEVFDVTAGSGTDVKAYVPKIEGTNANTDNNGFLKGATSTIIAIGDKAFEDTTNVDDLILTSEIVFIGDLAFKGSFIKSISCASVKNIGNAAFKNCSQLKNVTFGNATSAIGTEAFYGSAIASVIFPYTIGNIADGAFAECRSLKIADLSAITSNGSKIGNYAFYNDIGLDSVTFSDNTAITAMGTGAFAVDTGVTGGMTEFRYPSGISNPVTSATAPGDLGDYTLAGRSNLTKAVMPSNYGRSVAGTIPKGTFNRCINLGVVEFPSDGNGSCGFLSYDKDLFSGVFNPDFYVLGPELDSTRAKASPRLSTWNAETGVVIDPTTTPPTMHRVPYVYFKDGVKYSEVTQDKYLQQINDKGELTSIDFLKDQSGPIELLTIPSKIGEQPVTSIADGCFSKAVKDNMKALLVEDNSITKISDNVFKDCPILTRATIGNSVNAIGANAFLNCPKLVEVSFHSPRDGYDSFSIGADAFKTGSDELTFNGDIVAGYAPFEWATAQANVISQTTSKRVCYKSNAPTKLTVIRDNATNKVTLVDYPFYENIDIDNAEYIRQQDIFFTNKYPKTNSDGSTNAVFYPPGTYSILAKYKNQNDGTSTGLEWELVNQTELDIIAATQNLVVPAGIQSVDIAGFLNEPKNLANVPYIKMIWNGAWDGTATKIPNEFKNISKFELFGGKTKSRAGVAIIHPGLFSGNYNEYAPLDPIEIEDKGNDRLISVVLTDVEKLPDYAFDSCEALESVSLGKCTDVGNAPFAGDTKLETVIGNETYTCENGILYSKNTDGTLNLIECLASRGSNRNSIISLETDPLLAKVVTIKDGAFENCDKITSVDLSAATGLKTIPVKCFYDTDSLTRVYLPESVKDIMEDAFTGDNIQRALEVTIPGKEVSIRDNAFKHNQGTIRTYSDSAAYRYADKFSIGIELITGKFRVIFMDYDNITELNVQEVEAGKNATPPKDPTRVGHKFTGWNPSYENITRDITIVAQYETTGTGCKVWFKNWDNTDIIPVQVVEKGQNAVPPTTSPTRTGYTFGGWKPAYVNITEDTVIMAQWNSNGGNPEDPNGGGNGNGNGNNNNNNNNNNNDNTKTYNVKVNGGSGSGSYKPGSIVSISAFAVSDGRVFYRWTTSSNGVGFTGVETATTTFTMPNNDVNITATYGGPRTASSNNSVTDKKPTISGNTNTGGGGGSSSGGNKGNGGSTNTGNPGGTVISITKPGFSNTNVASALVNGSTDNYIIKVIEDSTAQAAIEAALLADAQTLENIKYFPMDISMYDSTGTTKVTNIEGITVDITLPIPDDLVQYAGNNKVAAVANGSLEKLPAKFKSIDGVPCVTFTATHFSPYAIYVDTANLTEGTTDTSPTTGDGIHPKWFLVLGLACISGILFVKRDRTVNKVKTA